MSAPEPEMLYVLAKYSDFPVTPTVPISALVHPAGNGVIATSSNVAVLSALSSLLHTARPIETLFAMLIVVGSPTWVQFTSSTEQYAVNTLPLRVRRTQLSPAEVAAVL